MVIKYLLAVFLNLAKTFDSIHHDFLFRILPTFRINNRNLHWFKSYLSYKKQIAKLNDVANDINVIEYGVPQVVC